MNIAMGTVLSVVMGQDMVRVVLVVLDQVAVLATAQVVARAADQVVVQAAAQAVARAAVQVAARVAARGTVVRVSDHASEGLISGLH